MRAHNLVYLTTVQPKMSESAKPAKISSNGMPNRRKRPKIRYQVRSNRFYFTMEKDIPLLEATILQNPWESGSQEWDNILWALQQQGLTPTLRQVKDRIATLIKNFNDESMRVKRAGANCAEPRMTRMTLIAELKSIIAQKSQSGAVDSILDGEIPNKDETNITENYETRNLEENQFRNAESGSELSTSTRGDEYQEHFDDRHTYMPRRPRINRDELLIKKTKLDHEYRMAQHEAEFEINKQKLALEQRRLDLEFQRENRIVQEWEVNRGILTMLMDLLKNKCANNNNS